MPTINAINRTMVVWMLVALVCGTMCLVKADRGDEVQGWLTEALEQKPCSNVVIYNTAPNYPPDYRPVGSTDFEFTRKVSDDGTDFALYWFDKGAFERLGDGGFINWAFGGNCKRESDTTFTCEPRC